MRIKQSTDEGTDQAFQDYIEAKRNADTALRKLEDAEAKLLAVMESKRRKTVKTSQDGVVITATYTQRHSTTINEQGLRKALTAKVFDRYTIKKLDRKALEQAMDTGDVDPVTVAKFVEQVPGKKFLTYRVKEEADEA